MAHAGGSRSCWFRGFDIVAFRLRSSQGNVLRICRSRDSSCKDRLSVSPRLAESQHIDREIGFLVTVSFDLFKFGVDGCSPGPEVHVGSSRNVASKCIIKPLLL